VFGRRKREEAAAADAAREEDRRVLFSKLAERPEHVCPFLGLAGERSEYIEGISDEHRCFAFGDPAPISAEQQTRVCQERGYGNCPRYLRGVLVIPTEELEALRQRRAPLPEPVAPPPVAESEGRRRPPAILLLGLLVLLLAGGAGAFLMLGQEPPVAVATPSPAPTVAPTVAPTDVPSLVPSPSATAEPSPTPEPSPTIPLNAITREEIANLLADSLDLAPATDDYYTDDDDSPFEDDINRLAEADLTFGCGTTRFCPEAFVTRAQLAAFVARALSLPPATQDYFTDDDGNLHEDNINRIAEAEITEGCAPDLYCPDDTVTRVEEELSRILEASPSP